MEEQELIFPSKESIRCVFILSEMYLDYKIIYLREDEDREFMNKSVQAIVACCRLPGDYYTQFDPELGFAFVDAESGDPNEMQIFRACAHCFSEILGDDLHPEGI